MKRILIILLSLSLIFSLLASCTPAAPEPDADTEGKSEEQPKEKEDEPEEPQKDTPRDTVIEEPMGQLLCGSAALGNVFFAQPESVFDGNTSLDAAFVNQLLPASRVIERGRGECPVYGIYGWISEYSKCYTDWTDVGFRFMRTTPDSDETMLEICASGISVMSVCGVGAGSYYTGGVLAAGAPELEDAANYRFVEWLEAVAKKSSSLLAEYGPNGTFFSRYPDANYNPIRAIETCNEPNFQYLLGIKKVNSAGAITQNDDANNIIKTKLYSLLHMIEYHTIKNLYPDDPISGDPQVLVVGLCAGGEHLDCAFIEDALKLDNTSKLGSDTLYDILNDAIASSALLQTMTGYNGTTKKMDIDIAHTMDVVSTHHYIDRGGTPFSYVGGPNDATWSAAGDDKYIRAAFAAQGVDGIPIWYTECGWEVTQEEGGLVKKSGGVTQIEQAMMEVMYYLYGIRNGVERISYMEMFDTDGCNYGLVNYNSAWYGDATWRKVMYAIQNMIRLLPNPALTRVVTEGLDAGKNYTSSGKDYAFIYELESDVGGETVTVVFSPIKKTAIRVPWENEYALMTDLFGATLLVPAENGRVTVEAGPALVYLRVPTAADLMRAGVIPAPEAASRDMFSPVMWLGEKNDL